MNRSIDVPASRALRAAVLTAFCAALSACGTYPDWLSSSGPSTERVRAMDGSADAAAAGAVNVPVVEVTGEVARRVLQSETRELFSTAFGHDEPVAQRIGKGDMLEVSVWEAPPAALFGAGLAGTGAAAGGARVTVLPEQMVSAHGTINVPFAGAVAVVDRAPDEVETAIVKLLRGKANQPQVLVRVIRNVTSNVTVVGEVTSSLRVPLSARGERLLDALAAAGGVRQPVNEMTLQVTRGTRVRALPLESVIRDPQQNIVLQPGDVVTAMFQPLSFTALGATGKNQEVNFEAQGITLAQALARVGGVADERADARGVFIFRFENPGALAADKTTADTAAATTRADGRVPVIYRVNLKDPATFFAAQGFPIRNGDVVYVANSPVAEWQKFLNVLSSVVYPIYTVNQLHSN